MGPVRKLSGVANIASKYDCSNPFTFRDLTFFLNFFQTFSENFDAKISTKIETATMYSGPVKIFSGFANLASKVTAQLLLVFEI